MPGGHGGRERPLPVQSADELWAAVVLPPVFVGLLLLATFLGRSEDPAWRIWLGRSLTAAFLAGGVWFVSRPRWRELRRRRRGDAAP